MEAWMLVVLIGLAAGALAHFVVPGKNPGGLPATVAVGVVGSLAAWWIGQKIGIAAGTAGFFSAVIGAALVLAVWRIATNRNA